VKRKDSEIRALIKALHRRGGEEKKVPHIAPNAWKGKNQKAATAVREMREETQHQAITIHL